VRIVLRFLKASVDRSWESTGRVDLVVGALLYLVGRALSLDLGLAAVAAVLGWFAIRVLLLTPAQMWHEAQQRKQNGGSVTVSPGATYINAPGATFTIGGSRQSKSKSAGPEQKVLWTIEQKDESE
jgi:hypothetical protein